MFTNLGDFSESFAENYLFVGEEYPSVLPEQDNRTFTGIEFGLFPSENSAQNTESRTQNLTRCENSKPRTEDFHSFRLTIIIFLFSVTVFENP